MGIVEGSILWYLSGLLGILWLTYEFWKMGGDITVRVLLQNLATALLGPIIVVVYLHVSGVLDKPIIKGRQ